MQDKEDLRGKDVSSNAPALSSTVVDVYITRTLYNMGEGIMNPGLLLSQLMQELD